MGVGDADTTPPQVRREETTRKPEWCDAYEYRYSYVRRPGMRKETTARPGRWNHTPVGAGRAKVLYVPPWMLCAKLPSTEYPPVCRTLANVTREKQDNRMEKAIHTASEGAEKEDQLDSQIMAPCRRR